MERGWDATGLLLPLWGRVGGRAGLAALTGITPQTLSAYNSGARPLGIQNARRIAEALAVSVLELGAPEAESDAASLTLLARLEEAEAALNKLGPQLGRLGRRVAALEKQVPPKKRRGGSNE